MFLDAKGCGASFAAIIDAERLGRTGSGFLDEPQLHHSRWHVRRPAVQTLGAEDAFNVIQPLVDQMLSPALGGRA
jgi:hypothetical protein